MKQFVSEEKICISPVLNVEILLFKENDNYYYYMYNVFNDNVYFIGKFKIESLISNIGYNINGTKLLVYNYKPMSGTNKNIVTKVLKLYDLIDNISIIDSIDNIIDMFDADYLVSNSSKLLQEKYNVLTTSKNLKSKLLNCISYEEFNEYLTSLKINSLGVKNKIHKI